MIDILKQADMTQAPTHHSETSLFGDPDCLRCMRRKLRATGVVVFFRRGDEWLLGNFEGDKPQDAAETDFECMLQFGVPQALEVHQNGIVLADDRAIQSVLGKAASLLLGNCVIAAPVHRGGSVGLRLAWRDQSDPFSGEELRIVQCEGLCPSGCD